MNLSGVADNCIRARTDGFSFKHFVACRAALCTFFSKRELFSLGSTHFKTPPLDTRNSHPVKFKSHNPRRIFFRNTHARSKTRTCSRAHVSYFRFNADFFPTVCGEVGEVKWDAGEVGWVLNVWYTQSHIQTSCYFAICFYVSTPVVFVRFRAFPPGATLTYHHTSTQTSWYIAVCSHMFPHKCYLAPSHRFLT